MSPEAELSVGLEEQIALAERLLEERRLPEARAAFHVAERMGADPDGCSAARWMVGMLGGDFESAWRESDAIRSRGGHDPHRFWAGEDVRGREIIVRCLHGFGDAIQFLRYMPRLQAMARRVVLEVPPRMVDLAPMLEGVGEVITWGELAPASPPTWEVQVEVMELPYLFRTASEDLPLAIEYLRVPKEDVERAGRAMGSAWGPRVGLVWAAGEWNPARSIPTECMEALVLSGCAEFWSLQGGAAREGGTGWVSAGVVRDAAVCGEGLRVLAAVIANLDLVISVDTLAVHMAGAMGKPAWMLLQQAADWRWMCGRTDSPWYPKARLFRQDREGDWAGVMENVLAELRATVGGDSREAAI